LIENALFRQENNYLPKGVIDPQRILTIMLDEIKLRRPGATLKSSLWELVGFVHFMFPEESADFREETKDIMFSTLIEQVESEHFEIKHMCGLLKGFSL
jgi:hypothetical protein